MSQLLKNALAVAMEELVDGVPEELETLPEVAVPEALNDVAESEGEYQEAEAVVEELENAAVATENLVAGLESTINEGGMSQQAATMYHIALESILARLPLQADRYTVAVESFGGTRDKLTASQEAFEKTKEVLKKIWQGIKNAVTAAWNAVRTFFATIGKSAKALKAGAADLQSKASAAGSHKLKENAEKIKVPKALAVGSNADVAANLKKVVSKGGELATLAGEAKTELSNLAKIIGTGNADSSAVAEKVYGIVQKAQLGKDLPGQGEGDGAEVTVPAVSEASAIAGEVKAIADVLDKLTKTSLKEIDMAVQDAVKKADSAVNKNYSDHPDLAVKIKAELQTLSNVSNKVRTLGATYTGYAARTAKAGLGFGYSILKQYKAEK